MTIPTASTASAALTEALAFLVQFARTAKSTGSIAPSGAALSRALTRHIRPGSAQQPRAVLAGPYNTSIPGRPCPGACCARP
ncbi:hypothetical protein ACWDR3_00220 [Streptomyces sp. NPDC001002]